MPVPDFSPGEVLTAAAMDKVGLWLIETKDVTAAGTIDFTSVFSSNYSGYRLIANYTMVTNNGNLLFQFRDSSGPITSNYLWNWHGSYISGGSNVWTSYSYQTTVSNPAFICNAIVGGRTHVSLDTVNPQNATPVSMFGTWNSIEPFPGIGQANIVGNVTHNASVTRTGFRLTTSAGTATGKFSLYGYRN